LVILKKTMKYLMIPDATVLRFELAVSQIRVQSNIAMLPLSVWTW
jgi:hypothetical protein